MMMAAQLQFYEMEMAGLSYIMDPKQVVFTGDQEEVVKGVLNRKFDVGFIRTNIIEGTLDGEGKPIDADIFKVIDPRIFVLDDGSLFPFLHSTDIYPEWPIAALQHVPKDISLEVQDALIAIGDHHDAYARVEAGITWNSTRCDTTPEIAQLAHEASHHGQISGFRTAMSYFEVRTMQQAAGFMVEDANRGWQCTRASTLYDSIKCPSGHYKLPIKEYGETCAKAGLPCQEGFECYCKPCVNNQEVNVHVWKHGLVDKAEHFHESGCEKMSVCGTVQQTKTIGYHIVDNKMRPNSDVKVLLHLADKTKDLPLRKLGEFDYKFFVTENTVGIGILEIFVDGEQIPTSPVRVQIVDRECDVDFPGEKRKNDQYGMCHCRSGTMSLGSRCVESTIAVVIISFLVVIFVSFFGYCYVRYCNNKNDQMWMVSIEELQFDDPVKVIGQGFFGVVLLADYRGTKVSLKRAIKVARGGSKHGRKNRSSDAAPDKQGSSLDTHSIDLNSVNTSKLNKDSVHEHDEEKGLSSKGSTSSQSK